MIALQSNDTLAARFLAGRASELSYMTDAQADAARALEAELTLDARAGVDLRVRLVGAGCSR
jgi:hypothetical protein